ncbi:sugar transferase [Nocardioides terrisoli]|uniref:sugar transferase n=1 Tax=Nocardioides terrisoli TaxID=3388267 RepID=UPI00287B6761|nr:sugar transferase [Nocardioides marmorisolisilvae]
MTASRQVDAVAIDAPPITSGRTHLQRRLDQAVTLVFLVDIVALVAASLLAWQLRAGIDSRWSTPFTTGHLQPSAGPWLVALWALVLLAGGAYDPREFGAKLEEFRSIVLCSVITLGLVGFIGFLSQSRMSRGYVLLLFAIGIPLLLVVRYADRKVIHALRQRGRLIHRVIAVGHPGSVAELDAVLRREPWTGYRVVGMCAPVGVDTGALTLLGTVDELPRIAVETEADTVLVAGGSYSSASELRRLGWALEGLDLDMLVVPSLTDVAGPRVHFSHVAGLPLVHVQEPQIDEAMGLVKRTFDLVISAGLLVVLALPMLVVALVIKAQDGGPVFYRQHRVGGQQRDFGMFKFRSMVVGADRVRTELDHANETDGLLFKIREDPRVTRFGRFIRKYSIDEIPQLFNVIRGEMSLVGPRPPLPEEVAQYDGDVHRRLLVRPGMTGLWQVSGRSDLSWEESVRLDLYYVDNWSLTSDLVILLKTARAVLLSSGAY